MGSPQNVNPDFHHQAAVRSTFEYYTVQSMGWFWDYYDMDYPTANLIDLPLPVSFH